MKKVNYAPIIVIAVILFFGINNFIWLKADRCFPLCDAVEHLWRALDYFSGPAAVTPGCFMSGAYYLPLFYYISCLMYYAFGFSYITSVMTNAVFLVILTCSVYKIGAKIISGTAGLFSAFLVLSYPIVFSLSRSYMLDFALCSMVSLSFCLLLYADEFKNRWISCLFGISLGLGMLIKPLFIIFLACPLFFTLLLACRRYIAEDGILPKKSILTNVFCSLALGSLITAIWYLPRWHDIVNISYFILFKAGPALSRSPTPFFSGDMSLFYALGMINTQISFSYFLLFLGGLICLFFQKKTTGVLSLLMYLIIPYLIFTFTTLKDIRFTVSLLPAVAVISSCAVMSIKNKFFRRLLAALVVLYGVMMFYSISYRFPKEFDIKTTDYYLGEVKLLSNVPEGYCGGNFGIERHNEPMEILKECLDFIRDGEAAPVCRNQTIGVISSNAPPLFPEQVRLFARMRRYPYTLVSLSTDTPVFTNRAGDFDYLLTSIRIDTGYGEFIKNLRALELIKEEASGGRFYVFNVFGAIRSDEPVCLKEVYKTLKSFLLLREIHSPLFKVFVYKNTDRE